MFSGYVGWRRGVAPPALGQKYGQGRPGAPVEGGLLLLMMITLVLRTLFVHAVLEVFVQTIHRLRAFSRFRYRCLHFLLLRHHSA